MRALIGLLCLATLTLAEFAASADDSIADIVAHPDAYDGVSMTVVGEPAL